jgi:hypothetical protein
MFLRTGSPLLDPAGRRSACGFRMGSHVVSPRGAGRHQCPCKPGEVHSCPSPLVVRSTTLRSWTPQIEPWSPVTFDKTDRLSPPTDEAELEVMTAIYNLSNMVIANNASRSLTRQVQAS